MPIGSLLNAASSVAGAATGAPVGPSNTEITPNVEAVLSAPFAVGRGASATPVGGFGSNGLLIAAAVVVAVLVLSRRR